MLIKKKSAITAFYYFIAVDKNVSDEEIDMYESIANEIDPDSFNEYKDSIDEDYQKQIDKIIDEDDFFDVILEGIDQVLLKKDKEKEEGVSSRYLLWNLLVVAYSDGDYSYEERKLLKHIARMLDIEKDIFLEMEQLMKANVAVNNELATIEKSDKPYNEIRPIVEELENRRKVIIESATTLIEDELYIPVKKVDVPKNSLIGGTMDVVGNVASDVASGVVSVASTVGDQTTKFFGSIMKKTGKLFS